MGITRYDDVLDKELGVKLSVYFHSHGHDVTEYSLVLLLTTALGVETIRVYDSTHRVNEMHRYTRSGGKQNGVVFSDATLGEGMRAAMRDIKKGYLPMIEGGRMTVKDGVESPASKKLEEAIDAVLEEKPIVPDKSSFIDANTPSTDHEVRRAAEKGYSAVVVSPDGSMKVVPPEEILGADAA